MCALCVCVRPIILGGVRPATRTQLTQREMYLFMPLSHTELHTGWVSSGIRVRDHAHTHTRIYTCWNEVNKQRKKQNISLNVALECILTACYSYLESTQCSRGSQSFSAGLGTLAHTHTCLCKCHTKHRADNTSSMFTQTRFGSRGRKLSSGEKQNWQNEEALAGKHQ